MKSKKGVGLLILCTMFVCTTLVEATLTIATFDDPAGGSDSAFFRVDLTNNLITGGWDDSKTGLNLDVVYSGNPFPDAFFTMTPVSYTGGLMGGPTGGGIIKFFADGQSTGMTPLIQIEFDSANLSPTSFGGVELFGNDLTISGSEIGGATLTDEAFSFGFANQVLLNNDWDDGFTATAAFTSSAVPEPATLALLGIGALITLTRRRRPA